MGINVFGSSASRSDQPPRTARPRLVLEAPGWVRWVVGIVLALAGLAAFTWASRQDLTRQYLGIAAAGICYLGVLLQIKWAWDAYDAMLLRRQSGTEQ